MEDIQARVNRETVRGYRTFVVDETVDLTARDLIVDVHSDGANATANLPNPILTMGKVIDLTVRETGSNSTAEVLDHEGVSIISESAGGTGYAVVFSNGDEYRTLVSG
ncbi:MAG: hypothetical protein V5A79_06580 [Candidatus Bipolaricaulota bacterium]